MSIDTEISVGVSDEPLTLEQIHDRGGWPYVLHQLTDYDDREHIVSDERWEAIGVCPGRHDAADDEDCPHCRDAHDEVHDWRCTSLLVVARWARLRWPGLVIDAPGIDAADLDGPLYEEVML